MKEEELDFLLAQNNLEISNVALSKSITPSIVNNIKKNQETIDEMEKIAMVGIIGKFMDLEKIIANYAQKDNHKELVTVISSFLGEVYGLFKNFYHYNLYMTYEKQARKDLQNVKNNINKVTKNTPDYQEQITLVEQNNLLADYLTCDRNYRYLKKGFAFERKKIDASVAKYEFTDYIFLLDSEIEKMEKILGKYDLPADLRASIKNWYQRLNQTMEESIYTINEYRRKYQSYCLKYGVIAKSKSAKEQVVALLELFNPKMGITYNGSEIYIADIEHLYLPNGFSFDKETGILTGYNLDQAIRINVRSNYEYNNIMTYFRKVNPESKLYISKIDGYYTITTNEDIENLHFPVGFYYTKNPQNGEIIITNKVKGDMKALKIRYRQVTKDAKKVVKEEPIKAKEPVQVATPKKLAEPVKTIAKEPEIKQEFSSKPTKVTKHLKQETKNPQMRKYKGLLKVSSQLSITGAMALVSGGAAIGQGLSKVINGIAKLGDILTGKLSLLAKNLSSKEKAKLQTNIDELKQYRQKCAENSEKIAKEIPKVEPKVPNVPPKAKVVEPETFDLEDILEEFRGR